MTTNAQAAQPRHTETPRTDTTPVRAAVAVGATVVSAFFWLVGALGEQLDFLWAEDAAWIVVLLSWPVTLLAGAMAWEQGNLQNSRRDRRAGLVAIDFVPVVVATWLVVWWVS
jgi:hypothetical protein